MFQTVLQTAACFWKTALSHKERYVATLTHLRHHEGIWCPSQYLTAEIDSHRDICYYCRSVRFSPLSVTSFFDRHELAARPFQHAQIGLGLPIHFSINSVRFVVSFFRSIRFSLLYYDSFVNFHLTGTLMACVFSILFCEIDYMLLKQAKTHT